MASYEAARAVHKTLSGTTVDMVTITETTFVEILNRADSDGTDITVTYGRSEPADPTTLGDDTDIVRPGESLMIDCGQRGGYAGVFIVKLLGNGNPYSVIGSEFD